MRHLSCDKVTDGNLEKELHRELDAQTINNEQTMQGGGTGTVLAGRYRVVRQLGQGGMGSVWLAEDTQLDNKPFAIKMLPAILVANKRAYRQLKDEALVAMRLVHPNIVQIRAFEENNGNPFLVMDYIEGQTLDDYLAEHTGTTGILPVGTGIPESDVLRILRPIAATLDYAHGEGVVHRDVKPANVMIRKDGHPFILDFGIAREIQETMTRVTGKLSSGTLLYMSPEQLRGLPPKAAQDVYSFAAMAYECLKGEPPFSRGQIEYQILNEQPERLPDDIRLSASIMRGLSKTPETRPDSCVKVLLAASSIRQMPSARPKVAVLQRPAPPMADRIVVRQKRNIAGIVIPLSCLFVALLVLGGVLWHREVQRQENVRKLVIEQQQEEARRRQAEDERKTKEETARKRAEAERLAKLKQEGAQRKAEEDAKRLEEEKQAAERELARHKEEEARKVAEAKRDAEVTRMKTEAEKERAMLKKVSVESSRNENKPQRELLPFYFQTCTPIPNGRHRFTFRDNKGRKTPYGTVMVYSVLKGEEIGKSGFMVTGYENKTESRAVPGSGLKKTVDVSTVEITRLSDGYKVNLLIGDRQCYVPIESPEPIETTAPRDGWSLNQASVPKANNDTQPMVENHNPAFGEVKALSLPGGVKMEMIYVAPGSFLMGSPASENGRKDDEIQHRVTLTKGYWLGKYEVTQEEWQSVMGENPSYDKKDRYPVVRVSWDDCQVFIRKINFKLNCGARLPTEAEWEYACRAGTTTAYHWGSVLNGDKANCNGNFPYGTTIKGSNLQALTPVGHYDANPWGFYDMHGNAREWCNDWYDRNYYADSPTNDPQGPASGRFRVLRGGSMSTNANNCRSAFRIMSPPEERSGGIRLCCDTVPNEWGG